MPPSPSTRRRFLRICAAPLGLLPLGLLAAPAKASLPMFRWQGTALGAEGSISLYHPDRDAALVLIERAVAEIERLERIFSLYRPDSALSILNRDGRLDAPPLELVVLVEESLRIGRLSGGAFSVAVQPLWQLYADHFSRPDADPAGPDAAAIVRACGLADDRAVRVEPGGIALLKPGMALTLNGIAQGYITDRVADLLREAGLADVLVDLGEIRALGRHPDGRPWRVGLDAGGRLARTVELADRAVATSAGSGLAFDPAGRFQHLLDPRCGKSADFYRSVSVMASRATIADALSTALWFVPPEEAPTVLAQAGPATAVLTRADGSLMIREG